MERDNREPLRELARTLIGQVEQLLEATQARIELTDPDEFIESIGGFDVGRDASYMRFFAELHSLWKCAKALQLNETGARDDAISQLDKVKKLLAEFH
jgi:hypothetical protein